MFRQLFDHYDGVIVKKHTSSYLRNSSGAPVDLCYLDIKDASGKTFTKRYSRKTYSAYQEGDTIHKPAFKWEPIKSLP